jgi:hypothetical protein
MSTSVYTPIIRSIFRLPGFEKWYRTRVRFHEYGLLTEDLIVERPVVAAALATLTPDELAARNFRIKRAQAVQVTQGTVTWADEKQYAGYLFGRVPGELRRAKEDEATRY